MVKSDQQSTSALLALQSPEPHNKAYQNINIQTEYKHIDIQTKEAVNRSTDEGLMDNNKRSRSKHMLSDVGNDPMVGDFGSPHINYQFYQQKNTNIKRMPTQPNTQPFVFNSRNGSVDWINNLNSSDLKVKYSKSQLALLHSPLKHFLIENRDIAKNFRNVLLNKTASKKRLADSTVSGNMMNSRSRGSVGYSTVNLEDRGNAVCVDTQESDKNFKEGLTLTEKTENRNSSTLLDRLYKLDKGGLHHKQEQKKPIEKNKSPVTELFQTANTQEKGGIITSVDLFNPLQHRTQKAKRTEASRKLRSAHDYQEHNYSDLLSNFKTRLNRMSKVKP